MARRTFNFDTFRSSFNYIITETHDTNLSDRFNMKFYRFDEFNMHTESAGIRNFEVYAKSRNDLFIEALSIVNSVDPPIE